MRLTIKRTLVLVGVALLAVTVRAAVPSQVNYQGRLTDNTPGQVPIDATVTMGFSIWDSATGGVSLWNETQSVSVAKGLFNVLLGSTTPIPSSVFTSGATRYLEISVSGETLAPRQQIAAAPFASSAARADDAGTLGGVGAAGYQQRVASPCPAGYAINSIAADGTATCIQGAQGPPGPSGPPGPPGQGADNGAISGSLITCAGPDVRWIVNIPGRSVVAYTATDGSFLLTNLPAGTYEVDYASPGYAPGNYNKLTDATVSNGQTTALGVHNFTDTSSDISNCGACGNVCPGKPNMSPTCAAGSCSGSCFPGYADCNNDKPLDGCEVNLRSSPTNCGSCGYDCSALHFANPQCANSACFGSCATGWADCNNNAADGCERDVSSDPNNCGNCNAFCSPNHITRACANSSCQAGTCDPGWGDCNNDKFLDGCEVDLNTTAANCGTCGHACGGGTPNCSGGVCVP